jgi:hypothetical protein
MRTLFYYNQAFTDSIKGVSGANYLLVAFDDIYKRNGNVLFFTSLPNTTQEK